jgi:hypothetical protein
MAARGNGCGESGWRWAPFRSLFTRRFLSRRAEAIRDARLFFVLGNRSARKQRLLAEARALAARVTAVADEVLPRLTA